MSLPPASQRVSTIPVFASLLLVTFMTIGCAHLPYVLPESRDHIVAIDVALSPDMAVAGRAAAERAPVTLVRGFVRSSDVARVSSVVAFVMATTRLQDLNLRATGYQAGQWNGLSGTALVLEPNEELRRLEERMVAATRPFRLTPEAAQEFIMTPDGSRMSDETIAIVDRFVPDGAGVNYRPHIFIAGAEADAAKRTAAQPADQIAFRSVGAAIYQIGAGGVAERVLWNWTGEIGAR
jgi:hypothetical protein